MKKTKTGARIATNTALEAETLDDSRMESEEPIELHRRSDLIGLSRDVKTHATFLSSAEEGAPRLLK